MATTVAKTKFTSKIVETLTLKAQPQQVITTLEINDVTDYSQRIMSVAITSKNIFTLDASDAGGAIDKTRMQYVRITNLDDTNNIQLTFQLTTDQDTYEVVIGPKKSHILTHKQGDTTTGGAASSLEDLTSIKGVASTAACDVEIFTVST